MDTESIIQMYCEEEWLQEATVEDMITRFIRKREFGPFMVCLVLIAFRCLKNVFFRKGIYLNLYWLFLGGMPLFEYRLK